MKAKQTLGTRQSRDIKGIEASSASLLNVPVRRITPLRRQETDDSLDGHIKSLKGYSHDEIYVETSNETSFDKSKGISGSKISESQRQISSSEDSRALTTTKD